MSVFKLLLSLGYIHVEASGPSGRKYPPQVRLEMRPIHRVGALDVLVHLALVSHGGISGVRAQSVIPEEVSCSTCELELVETQRVGDSQGHELFDDITRFIARDSRGRLWIPNFSIPDIIQVYSLDGSYEEFTRPGVGPGEFERIDMLTCLGDDFLVLDDRQRFAKLDPEAEALVHLSNTGLPQSGWAMGMLSVSDSTVWMAAPVRDLELLGHPILVLNPQTGEVTLPLGKEVDHFDNMVERHLARLLARLPGNRVLAAAVFSYELFTYADNGWQLQHHVRISPWFPPQMGIYVDVAVTGVVPLGVDVIAVLLQERDEGGFLPLPEEIPEQTLAEAHNSVIEVIDLRDGSVLARARVPQFLVGPVCPTGEIAGLAEGSNGVDHLRLYELEFRRR